LFNCFRASCTCRGMIPVNGLVVKRKGTNKPDFRVQEFNHETSTLTDEDYAKFEEFYELTSQDLLDNKVTKCPSRQSYVFPIYNLLGYEIGVLERWYSWQGLDLKGPKARYYKTSSYPKLYLPISA